MDETRVAKILPSFSITKGDSSFFTNLSQSFLYIFFPTSSISFERIMRPSRGWKILTSFNSGLLFDKSSINIWSSFHLFSSIKNIMLCLMVSDRRTAFSFCTVISLFFVSSMSDQTISDVITNTVSRERNNSLNLMLPNIFIYFLWQLAQS